LTKPKLYKIGLKNYCFTTGIFWRWITYGLFYSLVVFVVSFFTFTYAPALNANVGDLWINGTFAYGAVVILCNTKILFDSYSHYWFSVFFILGSIASYFAVVFLFNLLEISSLYGIFFESIAFPVYFITVVFFLFLTFPLDSFLYFINTAITEGRERVEKERLIKEKRQFTKGLDPAKLAPLRTCKYNTVINISVL
jgi:magnesium-transporting ATPase (P-type)